MHDKGSGVLFLCVLQRGFEGFFGAKFEADDGQVKACKAINAHYTRNRLKEKPWQ